MNISKKILRAINEGVLNALSFDDELPDTELVKMKKVHNLDVESELIKGQEKLFYSEKLYLKFINRPKTEYADDYDFVSKWIVSFWQCDNEFIWELYQYGLELHEKYGAMLNPHIDGSDFKALITGFMFAFTYKRAKGPLDLNWIDTSEVTDMSDIFSCRHVPVDISEWDTSNVISMERMFYDNQYWTCDISNWDVSNVSNFVWMFGFNKQLGRDENFDLSKWNVITDTIGMLLMFKGTGMPENRLPKKCRNNEAVR